MCAETVEKTFLEAQERVLTLAIDALLAHDPVDYSLPGIKPEV